MNRGGRDFQWVEPVLTAGQISLRWEAYRWKYHSPITAATATRPTPRITPHDHTHTTVTMKMSQPA